MGVKGLRSQLERHARPRVVTLCAKEMANQQGNVLLIDASALFDLVVTRVASRGVSCDYRSEHLHENLYMETYRYIQGLQSTGLSLVVVMDSCLQDGTEPSDVSTFVRRRRRHAERTTIPGLSASMVFTQALVDARGCRLLRASRSAPQLILGLYRKLGSAVFALLTSDTSFCVYPFVERVSFISDASIDVSSCTFQVWDVNESWVGWRERLAAEGSEISKLLGPRVDAKRRAQVAVLMGYDDTRDTCGSPDGKVARQAAAALPAIPSPALAALLCLVNPDDDLDLAFFTDTLGMKKFDEAHLEAFNTRVQAFVDCIKVIDNDVEASAEEASRLMDLAASDESVAAPKDTYESVSASAFNVQGLGAWIDPAFVTRLARSIVPECVLAWASCGLSSCDVRPLDLDKLRPLLQAAAAAMLATKRAAAGGADAAAVDAAGIYESDVSRLAFIPLVPPKGSAPTEGVSTNVQHRFSAAVAADPLLAADTEVEDAPPLTEAAADAAAAAVVKATVAETCDAIFEQSAGKLPRNLAVAVAVMLHVCGAAGASPPGASEVRALLLPDTPVPGPPPTPVSPVEEATAAPPGPEDDDEDDEGPSEPAPDAAPKKESKLKGYSDAVDVGSTLSAQDWLDIDHRDVVARTKMGASYKVMSEIQPWSGNVPTYELREKETFGFFYIQRDLGGGLYKKLAKQCYPTKYAEMSENKQLKKEYAAMKKEDILDLLGKPKGGHVPTLRFLEAVGRGEPSDLLKLRRDAVAAGPGTVQWTAARLMWNNASETVKDATFELSYSCFNKFTPFGKPTRHKHQEHVLEMMDKHLDEVDHARNEAQLPLPLHIILSTPTGSGKTFTAIMTHLHLLKPKHPNAILLYSVPTKNVLKRVGQECEAHNLVYWTAAKAGDRKFQVRRPYSIRTKRNRDIKEDSEAAKLIQQLEKGSMGSGPIEAQLHLARRLGEELMDRGNGQPDVIVADVHATAEMLAWSRANVDDVSNRFHRANLLLYYDEPNMGIHLDERTLQICKTIMWDAPYLTVLASATIDPWGKLPAWWKGRCEPAQRCVITQEPYELPSSRLHLWDETAKTVTPLSPLHLFKSFAEFSNAIACDERLRILLLRHLSSQQGTELLSSGQSAQLEKSEKKDKDKGGDWMALHGELKSVREACESEITELTSKRFDALKEKWTGRSKPAATLRELCSKQGVTMVATVDARAVALQLAGIGDEEKWNESIHRLKQRKREADRINKMNEKEEARRAKDEEEEAKQGLSVEGGKAQIALTTGLQVSVEDAESVDDNTLVMLSRGIAYSRAEGEESLVKRLFQQTLLHVPEKAMMKKQPPIHTLVMDYSSIYGTDCQGVDVIILLDDLGRLLTYEDHLQFLGRLRRDGSAIYTSLRNLRAATLGALAASEAAAKEKQLLQEAVETALIDCLAEERAPAKCVESLLVAAKAEGRAARDVADPLVRTMLKLSQRVPHTSMKDAEALRNGDSACSSDKEYLVRFKTLLTSIPKPLKYFCRLDIFSQKGAFDGVMEVAASEARVAATVPHIVKFLYDADCIEEDVVIHWHASTEGKEDLKAIRDKLTPFVEWLQQSEDEDEDDDEDDDDE